MGTVLAVTSALTKTYAQNKALEAQGKANQQTAKNIVRSQNYSFQNLEQERSDAFESTVAELERTNLQGNRQEASVRAAVNEGIMGGGRTANLINRAAEADTNRTLSSVRTNYEKKSNEIDLNKEAASINAKQQISSIKNVEAPSLFSTMLSIGSAVIGSKATQESIGAIRSNAGVDSPVSQSSGYSGNLMTYNYDSKTFTTTLANKASYTNLLGDIDFGNKFKFGYTNPYINANKFSF